VYLVPNLITLARLFAVPVVVWAISTGEIALAFWLFVAAGISDAIDGFIAKRFHLQSELGAYLDPLADKALLVSIYVSLGIVAAIPVWLAVLVVARDLLIIGAILLSVLLLRPVAVRPIPISKVNTLAQILLAAVVLGDRTFMIGMDTLKALLEWLVAGLTIASAGAYLVDWLGHMGSGPPRA
jgi:cardiolipin synthase